MRNILPRGKWKRAKKMGHHVKQPASAHAHYTHRACEIKPVSSLNSRLVPDYNFINQANKKSVLDRRDINLPFNYVFKNKNKLLQIKANFSFNIIHFALQKCENAEVRMFENN